MNNQATIGVLQITRFGDLIQTATACEQFKLQYPQYKLVLICREKFGKPFEFLLSQIFDKIYYLDLKQIIETPTSIEPGIKNISFWLENINNENLDILVNFSWSKSSQYIAHMIKAKNHMGLKCDRGLRPVTHDSWSTLVFSSVMRGLLNPFNLVDIYMGILGVKRENIEIRRNQVESNQILLHPFASVKEKTWSTDKWIEIIYQVIKNREDIIITIVGSKSDTKSCEDLYNSKLLTPYQDRIKIAPGTLSMVELFEIAQNSTLFIGSDSMVGQLSAFAGIQTLTLSKGSVRPHETTPYGNHNFNLKLKEQSKDLPYQVVMSCINQILDYKDIDYQRLREEVSLKHLRTTYIYQTQFSNTGFLDLKEIQGHETTQSAFRTIYKILWAYYIEGAEENCSPPKLTRKYINQLKNYIPAFEQLFELIDFGKKYSLYIFNELDKASPNMDELRMNSDKLTEIDNLQIYLRNNYPYLGPLVDFFTVKKANLPGNTVDEIAAHSVLTYDDYSNLISALYELLGNVIKANDDEFKEQKQKEVAE